MNKTGRERIADLKITQLKNQLKIRKASISGNKDTLKSRLRGLLDSSYVDEIFEGEEANAEEVFANPKKDSDVRISDSEESVNAESVFVGSEVVSSRQRKKSSVFRLINRINVLEERIRQLSISFTKYRKSRDRSRILHGAAGGAEKTEVLATDSVKSHFPKGGEGSARGASGHQQD